MTSEARVMVNETIAKLIRYAEERGLTAPEDHVWAVNCVLDALKLDGYEEPEALGEDFDLAEALDELTRDAFSRKVTADDSVTLRDLLDAEIMGRLTPPPREVVSTFRSLFSASPERATDWYYKFSQDTNYIRRDRIARDGDRPDVPGGRILVESDEDVVTDPGGDDIQSADIDDGHHHR